VLGTDFISDLLLVSLQVQEPIKLRPSYLATQVALRTLSEALVKAACLELELEATELQAEHRPALTPYGQQGLEAEIYLYDTLPGGAGFARQAGSLGERLFRRALAVLEGCPDHCDGSCYRCLRSYTNKLDHPLLDRHVGAALLKYLLAGTLPFLDPTRIEQATELLFQDLQRQGLDQVVLARDALLQVPGLGDVRAPLLLTRGDGRQFIVDVTAPLMPEYATTPMLRDLQELSPIPVLLIDALVIRKNLPWATHRLLQRLGLR
jgi:hypothetical protein